MNTNHKNPGELNSDVSLGTSSVLFAHLYRIIEYKYTISLYSRCYLFLTLEEKKIMLCNLLAEGSVAHTESIKDYYLNIQMMKKKEITLF